MTHGRPANIQKHRARRPGTTQKERKDDMEPYRNQINAMLDTITDAKLMKLIHDVIRAIMFNR